jgi:hypothetical protein
MFMPARIRNFEIGQPIRFSCMSVRSQEFSLASEVDSFLDIIQLSKMIKSTWVSIAKASEPNMFLRGSGWSKRHRLVMSSTAISVSLRSPRVLNRISCTLPRLSNTAGASASLLRASDTAWP